MKTTLAFLLGACLSTSPVLAQKAPADLQPKLPRRPAAARAFASPTAAQLPTDPRSPISRHLQQLYRVANGEDATTSARGGAAGAKPTPAALRAAFPGLGLTGDQTAAVLVRITARDVNALRPLLEARGFRTVAARPDLHFIEGRLPVSQLAPGAAGVTALAAQGLLGVLPVYGPMPRAGRVTNQADWVLDSYRVRGAAGGFNGQGQRIGVMSDSYNALDGAAAGVAADELPANVQVLQDAPANQGTDEGRAMIELIHDIAPAAGVAFSSVLTSEADFANQIQRLADPAVGNCKILVDDIGFFAEPMFQDGVIAQAINDVNARLGVSYFSAAGNDGNASCEYASPVFVPRAGSNPAADFDFGASFVAGGPSDLRQRFVVRQGSTWAISLQWSDPFYTTSGVKTDLDFYLIKARPGGVAQRGDTVALGNDNNLTNLTPVEVDGFRNTSATDTLYDLSIVRRAGTANPTRIKYVALIDNIIPTEYFTASSTLTGHAAATGALAVAAAPSFNRLTPESFTALGLPTILFNPDGTPLAAPQVRQKPDFTSIDGVSTSFFDPGNAGATPDLKDGYLFFGTSAAAPNAAAVGALLLQAQPTFTPAQLGARLSSTAQDLSASGFDALTGAGLINAYRAIFGPPVATPVAAAPPFIETFDAAGLSPAWDTQGLGPGRALVRRDFDPASQPGHLVLDSFFPYYGLGGVTRLSQATLRLNLSTPVAGGYVLSFKHKIFTGERDEQMPATFTGSSNSDGVALSVDGGTTWYRLAIITGANASVNYQTVQVNLNDFATANGLTLGADVRIRFQRGATSNFAQRIFAGQVDSSIPVLRGGRAFDDVLVYGANATQAPLAQFSATPSGAPLCPGTTVQFQDASFFGPVTAYNWSFPGGNPSSSTAANPTVTYPAGGTYDVTLQITTANGTATRTVAGAVVISTAVPTAKFQVSRQTPICPGGALTFRSTSTNCAATLAWSFPGGTPSSSTSPNPTVTYAQAGTYTATLVASNASGPSTPTTFTVKVQGPPQAIPFAESFANGIPAAWTVINPDSSLTWTTAPNIVRRNGTRGTVAVMPFYPYSRVNQQDSLLTPPLTLSGTAAFLKFDVAYAPISSASATRLNDSLVVGVYQACTRTLLGQVYLKSASAGLPTTAAVVNDSSFVPRAASQWRNESVSLSAFLGQQVYLAFIAYNQYGNNLYLANVNVDGSPTPLATHALADSPALQVYPNPVGGRAPLTLTFPLASGTASVRIIDNIGRLIYQTSQALSLGASATATLPAPPTAGLYTVLCQTADGQLYSRRFVVE